MKAEILFSSKSTFVSMLILSMLNTVEKNAHIRRHSDLMQMKKKCRQPDLLNHSAGEIIQSLVVVLLQILFD